MEPEFSGGSTSSVQLLEELEVLSQSLYQSSHTSTTRRRTASFALPRTSIPTVSSSDSIITSKNEEKISQSMRISLSPWRSTPKPDHENHDKNILKVSGGQQEIKMMDDNGNKVGSNEKKGIWNWKPLRALSHIRMQRLSCLFSVDVVTVHGLPASMNGLRLSVCVRKKETKDGAVKTMPARVLQGVADFEETLFVKCHVHCSTGSGKQLKFEPRPFLIYVFAVDAQELDFGRSSVDLSLLVQKSMEKSSEGTRVRQWDATFDLSGKAKGAELLVKLGFQIMEKDGGLGIYGQADEGLKSGSSSSSSSSSRDPLGSFGRKQSKSSFSIPSQRMSSRMEISTPPKANFEVMDNFNLDEPAPVPSSSSSVQKSEEPESKIEDQDLPEFEVVDKGVEIQDKSDAEEAGDGRLVSSEMVKVVMNDQVQWTRLTELDSIAQRIRTLESMIADENSVKTEEETESQKLDEDEETVTREFLQMLEEEENDEFKLDQPDNPPLKPEESEKAAEADSKVFLPDLGKGLGCVVQTRDGGYLAAMNPFNIELSRKETPKLAMQLSKPLILLQQKSMSGFEMFQRMAAIGLEELSSQILSLMPLDELIGKTAEQVAFEGIASAIIQGRNTEIATSRAARSITAVKTMAAAMSTGRKDRISMGIWNVNREPITVDEILAFSLQKIEAMAVEALKIQAEMAEEDAPFDVSPFFTFGRKDLNGPFVSAVPLEDWLKNGSLDTTEGEPVLPATVTLSVALQLRDPLRRYEPVGGPMIVLIQATRAGAIQENDDEEERFNVVSLQVGGLKVRVGGKRHIWDAEKQRLTAMLWLVENGLVKAGKKGKPLPAKGLDSLWSISSRVMADMWLKQMRNPDVKFLKQQ
ncbi:EEIG1/EHBP1 N-terminal domain [Macleaya cordata]|uniref:EEIG1/EHBP1 N-terminal domain n=1 Tax=Macleaya cordata TaxID=56857 RepID=A0A200PR40_MACCD|nr:EEIG1/EHBP1 N-terminal domain [Macleaya cordata]